MSLAPPFGSPYTLFVFINEHSSELTLAVVLIVITFIVIRAIFDGGGYNEYPDNKPFLKPYELINNKSINNKSINNISPYSKPFKPIKSTKPLTSISETKPLEPISEATKPPKKQYKTSKVFYSNQRFQKTQNKSKPIKKNNGSSPSMIPSLIPSSSSSLYSSLHSSPTEHIEQLQKELDITCYPQYLDGYSALTKDQKTFLSAIKAGNLSQIKYFINNVVSISANINFGEYQVLRECVLSERLEILKYLKCKFVTDLDLNAESGYCLRWSSRKGLISIINYLLFQQKYQKIDISYFQYQAIEWSIVYGHKQIAKILQKYYNDFKLTTKWNVLQHTQQDLGVEFDIFNLPSIYQEIIESIINSDDHNNKENIKMIKKYYKNGCDLTFESNMAWTVAVDCTNIEILQFLVKTVGINPFSLNNYLLRTSLEIKSLEMLNFTKNIISWDQWKVHIIPNMNQFKLLCDGDNIFIKELENYHKSTIITPKKGENYNNNNNYNKFEMPQSPIPWPYESPHVRRKYGILTRSKRKMLVQKGILQEI